jgi:hypothetical protein
MCTQTNMAFNNKINWHLKVATERKSKIDKCLRRKHSGRKTNSEGYCKHCNTEFLLYQKTIELINILQKTFQIIALKKMKIVFTVNTN